METLQKTTQFNPAVTQPQVDSGTSIMSAFSGDPARRWNLQRGVRFGRKILPRGWGTFLRTTAKHFPSAQLYPAQMKDGDTLYLNLGENMCHDYFYYGELIYEKFTVEFMKEFLEAGDVCLDVGANLGYLTRLMAKMAGRHGAVHAYEPNPAAFRLLQANTHDLPQTTLHPLAVGDREGRATFSITTNGTTSSIGTQVAAKQTIEVQLNTLDNLAGHLQRIDFVKIDVEGFEFNVMRGGMSLIKNHMPLIYFEFLDDQANARKVSIREYESLLTPLGYQLRWVSPNYPFDDLTTSEPAYYVIAVPNTPRWRSLIN